MKWIWITLGIIITIIILLIIAKVASAKEKDPLKGYKSLGKVTFKKLQNNTGIIPDGYSEYDKETETFSSAKFRTDFKLIGSENIRGGKTKLKILNSKYYDGVYPILSWNGIKPITNFNLKAGQIEFKGNDEGDLYIKDMKKLQTLKDDLNVYYVPKPHEHEEIPGVYMAKHGHGIEREYVPT